MEPKVNLYVYWQEGGAKSPRGRREGLDWLITEDNYRFKERGRGNLYRRVAPGRKELTLPEDIWYARTFSTTFYPVLSICNRLLTTRTE